MISQNPNYLEAVRRGIESSPVANFFGFEIVKIDVGEVTLALDHRPEFGHQPGYFQASIMMAIADYAGCYSNYTLEPEGWRHAMLDQTSKFFGRAQGERLIARGHVISPGRTIMVSGCDLFVVRDGIEHAVATMLVTTHHTPPKEN